MSCMSFRCHLDTYVTFPILSFAVVHPSFMCQICLPHNSQFDSHSCVSSSLAILFHVAESCSHASVPFGWGRKAEKGRVDEAGLGLGSRLLHLQRRLTKLTPVHVAFNMTKGMRSILPSATTPYTAPRANTRPPKILSPKLATDDASMISVCPRNNASNVVKQPNRLKHNSAVTCMVSVVVECSSVFLLSISHSAVTEECCYESREPP